MIIQKEKEKALEFDRIIAGVAIQKLTDKLIKSGGTILSLLDLVNAFNEWAVDSHIVRVNKVSLMTEKKINLIIKGKYNGEISYIRDLEDFFLRYGFYHDYWYKILSFLEENNSNKISVSDLFYEKIFDFLKQISDVRSNVAYIIVQELIEALFLRGKITDYLKLIKFLRKMSE